MQRLKLTNEKSKLNLTCFVPADAYGCGFYRCFVPATILCSIGKPAQLITSTRLYLFNLCSTIVVQRPADASVADMLKDLSSSKVRTIFELDDNLMELPEWNPAYSFWTEERLKQMCRSLEIADFAVTTNEYLADKIRAFNPNVRIFPNVVIDNEVTSKILNFKNNDAISIGWVGSSFHEKDIEIFTKLVPIIMQKYSNVLFVTIGHPLPQEVQQYHDRIISLPFVKTLYYHKILKQVTINIGLAPLVDNEFNRSKSCIKLTEYMYSNAYPICSDIYPYRTLYNEAGPDSCILIPTSTIPGKLSDWVDAVSHVIDNYEKFKPIIEKNKNFILENYSSSSDKIKSLAAKVYLS